MIKQWLSGIFGYFFIRACIAIVSFAILLLVILMPFFRSQLLNMVENQGHSFANGTIAATEKYLGNGESFEVLDYVTTVLKNSPDILFVTITKKSGEETTITPRDWQHSKNQLNFNKINLSTHHHMLLYVDSNPITKSKCFVHHQAIMLDGNLWGVMSIGLSDAQYRYILQRYIFTVVSTSIFLILSLLLLFFRSSKKIRNEITKLSATAAELQIGNLSSKAPEYAIGEIGTLSASINKMAANLEDKTEHIIQLAQIVEQTNDAFILFDSQLNIIFVNEAISKVTGYPISHFKNLPMIDFTALLGMSLPELLQELEWMKENQQNFPTRDIVIKNKNNELNYVEMRLERISNIKTHDPNFLVVLANITERKELENELHQLAFYDKLTGLANRRMFHDHLHKSIKSAERNAKSFAIFFMDLDDFKNINDTLGHETGDLLLIETAKRIRDSFRGNDVVARLGGDEFTVIVEDVKEASHLDIAYLAEKLLSELVSRNVFINEHDLSISASLGIAIYPENGLDSETLIRNADTAMYVSKNSGKNRYTFFSDEMNLALRQHLALDHDLKLAVNVKDQLYFHLQPIVDLATNQVVGAEALARWKHPIKNYIPTVDFINLAEKSNLVISLSNKLLDIAFKMAHDWSKKSSPLYLSINISVRHFETSQFIDRLKGLLSAYDVAPQNIQLEFTESSMLELSEETLSKFVQLKNIGFKIAIDDFGTGYSSLGYIHQLPIDVIKIDRSFVDGMLENKKTKAIVSAICKLAAKLKIDAIAEGVELSQHAEQLQKFHCSYGQGFLYDKPLIVSEFEYKYLNHKATTIEIKRES